MKTREVITPSGAQFTVPRGIQRIDTRSTHGWQVRYHGTKFFSDGGDAPADSLKSLEKATRELLTRINTMPAPMMLKKGPSAHKTSDLPPGVSGPILKLRRGSSVRSAVLSVLLPRFGQEPTLTSVYIGSENTYTPQKFREALARAVEMRADALARYEAAATRQRRKEGKLIREHMRAMSAQR